MIADLLSILTAPTSSAALAMLVIKSTIVMALGLLLWLALRRSAASARHLVLGATLIAMLLLPVIAYFLPPLPVPMLSEPTTLVKRDQQPHSTPRKAIYQASDAAVSSTSANSDLISVNKPKTTFDVLLVIYLMGAAAILVHLLVGIARIWWISRRSSDIHHDSWQSLIAEQDINAARLLITNDLETPLTWGVVRPVVLMPAEAASWREQNITSAVRHELAHVDRKDWLVQIIARLICAVYWFNPLVWVALRYLVLEAELAADDRVLIAGAVPEDYAEQLVTLTQKTRGVGLPVAATTIVGQSSLSRRVHSILNCGEHRMPFSQVRKYALLSAVSVTAVLIGSVQLVAAPHDGADEASIASPGALSTPLIRAAAQGDHSAVIRLLKADADVNETSDNRGDRPELQRSALTTAARAGHLDIVRTLLDAGAPVDRVVRGDATALIEAVDQDHFDVAMLLIDRGADVNKAVRGSGSPLISAARANNVEAIKRMLSLGADPNLNVRGDGNALIAAARSANASAVEALMLAGARADNGIQGDGNAITIAAQRGDMALLQKMIEAGADVNASVEGDGSPLIQAARNGHADAVALLLHAGADINKIVRGDENALIGAAWAGESEIVDYLLSAGADPNIRAPADRGEFRTALRQARLAGHDDVVRRLQAAGAIR